MSSKEQSESSLIQELEQICKSKKHTKPSLRRYSQAERNIVLRAVEAYNQNRCFMHNGDRSLITSPKYELADLFRSHKAQLGSLYPFQEKVIRAIMSCRTEALGGHIEQCDHPGCGYENHAYNSCRNRNLPQVSVLGKTSLGWQQSQRIVASSLFSYGLYDSTYLQ